MQEVFMQSKAKGKGNLSVLMDYAGRRRVLTYLSWVLSAVSALTALVPFIFVWLIVREVIEANGNFAAVQGSLSVYGWWAVGSALISMLVYFAALMCSHVAAFRVAGNMRKRAMRHIGALPVGFMNSLGSGRVRRIVNESSGATETYLAHQLPDMVGAFATPVGMIVLLFVFDWRLGLLSLIPTVLGFIIMSKMTGKDMARKMKEYQSALENMNNEAVEYVRGVPVVKTFGQTVFSFKRFKGSIDSYHTWVVAYTKSLMWPMVAFTTAINCVFVPLIIAGLCFTAGGVDGAFLLNLIFYIIFTPIISVTLMKVMFMSENNMIVSDALQRIDGILAIKPLPEPAEPQMPQDNSVAFENAVFAYDGADRNAIDGITLDVKAGETVALVGPSGGGKTTAAGLVARFWDTASGAVKVGGVNVKDIDRQTLNDTVAYVFQDSKLLKTSIFENVRMGRPSATREEVFAALHNAQCDDILNKFPHGVDTVIGSKGVYLSGGEQQRIAIARVMLKNAPVLVLDEATAFADPENEAAVQRAFERLANGRTVIMIAHRLTTVQNADKIYVLKDGKIAEEGTHAWLMEQNGLYHDMYDEYRTSIAWKVGGRA